MSGWGRVGVGLGGGREVVGGGRGGGRGGEVVVGLG